MILDVTQTLQDMYAADFVISRSGQEIGKLSFRGTMSSRDGHWWGTFCNRNFEEGHDVTVKMGLPSSAYRPYQIYENQSLAGCIYNDTVKESFFSSYSVGKLLLHGNEFTMYFIGFGQDGVKNTVYCNGRQVAVIEKDSVIYNGLYRYRIFALDEYTAYAALCLCTYMYTCGGYKPGVRITESVKKSSVITKNKTVLSKFDPAFYHYVSP